MKLKGTFTTTEEIKPIEVSVGESETFFVYGGDEETITQAVKKALGIKEAKERKPRKAKEVVTQTWGEPTSAGPKPRSRKSKTFNERQEARETVEA